MLHECRTAAEVREHYKAVRKRTQQWKAPIPVLVDCGESGSCGDTADNPSVPLGPVQIEIVEHAQETQVVIHRQEQEPEGVVVHPSIARIADTVAAKFGTTRSDIIAHRRTKSIVMPRQITMYLARTLTLRSLPEIGYYLGDRDHTTILFGVRKITRLRAEDPELDAVLRDLSGVLSA